MPKEQLSRRNHKLPENNRQGKGRLHTQTERRTNPSARLSLDFWNVSLWIAVTSIILLIIAQLGSAYDGPASLLINAQRLKYAALTMGLLFLATVTIRI